MTSFLLGLCLLLLPATGAIFWLYRLVKAHQHADRQTWRSFTLALAAIVVIAIAATGLAATPLVAILGGKLGARTAPWVFFASVAGVWTLVRSHIKEPSKQTSPFAELQASSRRNSVDRFRSARLHHLMLNDMIIPIAISVAVASFFFIHDYNPKLGVLYAAQRGEIYLTDPEPARSGAPDFSGQGTPVQAAPNPASAQATVPFADLMPDNSIKLPYRDVLAVCLLLGGISFGFRRKKDR